MSAEVRLEPGWLKEDVRKASERLTEWAKARGDQQRTEVTDKRDDALSGGRVALSRDMQSRSRS
jgi:hypothetical protein